MRNLFGLHYAAPIDAVEEQAAPVWVRTALISEVTPGRHQAEGDPSTGLLNIRTPYGQAFRNAILFTGSPDLAGRGVPQIATHPRLGRDWAGKAVRQMSPLYNPPSGGGGAGEGFRDLVGAFTARAAFIIAVRNAVRYQGQIPTDQQQTIQKPLPWDDPTRGLP